MGWVGLRAHVGMGMGWDGMEVVVYYKVRWTCVYVGVCDWGFLAGDVYLAGSAYSFFLFQFFSFFFFFFCVGLQRKLKEQMRDKTR